MQLKQIILNHIHVSEYPQYLLGISIIFEL